MQRRFYWTWISTAFAVLVLMNPCIVSASYVDNGNGTVLDTATGLYWQQSDSAGNTWEEALDYCESLALAGSSSWRLPNVRELQSLVDETRDSPSINPIFDSHVGNYWTSTTVNRYRDNAWLVFFTNGGDGWGVKENNNFVRCVRGVSSPSSVGSNFLLLLQ